MDKSLLFLVCALVAAPVFADDLLDAVLREDTPAAKPAPASRASAPVPFGKPTAKAAPRISAPPKGAVEREEVLFDGQIRDARQRVEDAVDAGRQYMTEKEAGAREREEPADDGDRSVAEMERRPRLSLRAGGGGARAFVATGELTLPLWKSAFDLSLRSFFCHGNTTYHEVGGNHACMHKNYHGLGGGGEALALWRPFRARYFSPYAGIGGRYERVSGLDIGERYEQVSGLDGAEFSPAWRVGGTLNAGRFWLGGEYTGSKWFQEAAGTAGFRCGRHLALHVLAEWFEIGGDKVGRYYGKHDGTAFGGGVTWVF